MIGLGLGVTRGGAVSPVSAYAVAGSMPDTVYTPTFEASGGVLTTGLVTHTQTGLTTVLDSDGVLKWTAHNPLTYSNSFVTTGASNWGSPENCSLTEGVSDSFDGATTSTNVVPNTSNTVHRIRRASAVVATKVKTYSVFAKANGYSQIGIREDNSTGATAVFDLSDGTIVNTHNSGNFTVNAHTPLAIGGGWYLVSATFTDSGTTLQKLGIYVTDGYVSGDVLGSTFAGDGTSGILITGAHSYLSDLGGMQAVPLAERGLASSETYLPTTSAARYLGRNNAYAYVDGTLTGPYLLREPAATNLLHSTNALTTQTETVTAQPYTLHFTGTGTVTLSGASTAGPLVGTGTGENNRVSLTFTPSAGTLTLTVAGTVTNAQLETGSVPTSYIANTAGSGTATRNADTLTLPSPSGSAFSGSLSRLISYADNGTATEATLLDHRVDANNRITITLDTAGANTGKVTLTVVNSASSVSVTSSNQITPGVNKAIKVGWRVSASEINIALNGTAATAVTNTAGVPDLSSADETVGGIVLIEMERRWTVDLGDSGIATAST